MSELKDKLTEQVTKISEAVSDEKEKANVLSAVKDMVQTFTEHVIVLSEKQIELEKRVEEVFDVLSSIEEEMISSFGEDLQGECPYCGETIPLILPNEDAEEIECPKCHNMIELEMMLDEHDGCCGCDCDDCHHDCCDDEDKNDKE